MNRETVFHLPGTPAPQGSKRHVGRGILIEDSQRSRPWRDAVTWHAQHAHTGPPYTGPVAIHIHLHLPRPKSHYGTGRNRHLVKPRAPLWHPVKPDLDKLARLILDACTNARVIHDDSQVAQLTARKLYGEHPGVRVRIHPLTPDG
jgi:crossover junction endodeoxyribonuclease RusA